MVNPRIVAIKDAIKTAILESCTIATSVKARFEIKIDIVKPMPASRLAPVKCRQLTF